MKIPQFTAEASLYEASNRRRSLPFDRKSLQTNVVIPQRGGVGFKGLQGCILDCIDRHPEWKDRDPKWVHEQCRRSCVDPFGGVDLGTERSFWDGFLSDAGITFWEVGCTGITGASGPCGWLADTMRRQS
jgi:hypothetical protein